MKIIFTSQRSVNGIRVYSVQVDAKKKADRGIKSTNLELQHNRGSHDLIMCTPRVKVINGVEYLDI
jgi:hypothetical protein